MAPVSISQLRVDGAGATVYNAGDAARIFGCLIDGKIRRDWLDSPASAACFLTDFWERLIDGKLVRLAGLRPVSIYR